MVFRPTHRDRGIALMLTLLALAIAFILTMGFLVAEGPTSGLAQNLDRQAMALNIARSGINIGLTHIQTDTTWRTDNSNGVWINAQTLNGGTLTLEGEDGAYNSSTGIVTGSGSLTSNYSNPTTLISIGSYKGVTQILHMQVNATGGTTQLPGGLSSNGTVSVQNSGLIDSFNSANGAYSTTNSGSNAVVTTNSIASGTIAATGAGTIKGSVEVGPSGNTSTAVTTSGSGTITGAKSDLSSTVSMTAPTAPTNTGSSLGALSLTGIQTQTISSNCHYSSLSMTNSTYLYISGNVTMLIDGNVSIGGAAQFILNSGAKLTLAVGGTFTLSNSGLINTSSSTPGSLQINMLTSGDGMTINGAGCAAYAVVDMPLGTLAISNSGVLCGKVTCANATITGAGQLHLDTNPNTSSPGGSGSTTYTYTPFWIDEP